MVERVGFNAMQANIGLIPGGGQSSMGYPTPSAGDTALRLSQEATQRMSQAQQMISVAAAGGSPVAASLVGNQFQQRMQGIQSQQTMNPYAAQMMAQSLPGAPQYQQGYMPSPLMMTPASTGVFRPPPAPMTAPIAPMAAPMPSMSPFRPQMPAPMFRSPYEQQAQASDIWSNRMFSYASQAPGVAGQALGIGGAAMLGGRMGSALGPWGAAAGAIGGAAAAIGSGFAGGMGQMFQTPMRAPIETRQMGAALQNMTQSFVIGGPQVHAMGRGLNQGASMNLAGQMKDMAGDSGFQEQTGGMFNRQDLMQMVRRGGEAGLFDMAQSVPEIKNKLRETAGTIKQFMQLTNDPDITNVIREMGRLRQFGMNQQDMVSAAQGMKTYSRMAGTTIQGIQEIGGLPGAMTFQQAGLTAGTGFNYGNYAAGAARQAVAGGGISARQLSLMGGVQGMTQRDIQSQAAFSSMPLFGAANAQFGAGGWSAGGAGVGNAGAQGMVRNALGNMNAGIQQGGIGALAMYSTQQREVADQATANMTPEQLMAQRFGMAMQTGQGLGLSGMGAFALGSQTMFGQEVGEQMMYQARDPGFWSGQRQRIGRQRRQLDLDYAQQAKDNAPIMGGALRDAGRGLGFTGRGSWGRGVAGVAGAMWDAPSGIGEGFSQLGTTISNKWSDLNNEGLRRRHRSGIGAQIHNLAAGGSGGNTAGLPLSAPASRSSIDYDSDDFASSMLFGERNEEEGYAAMGIGRRSTLINTGISMSPVGFLEFAGVDVAGLGIAEAAISADIRNDTDLKEQKDMVRRGMIRTTRIIKDFDTARKEGGKRKPLLSAAGKIEKLMGGKGTTNGLTVLTQAGNKLDKILYEAQATGKPPDPKDMGRVLAESYREAGLSAKDAATAAGAAISDPSIRGQILHSGNTGARNAEVYTNVEGNTRTAQFDQITKAVGSRTDDIRARRLGAEEALDMTDSNDILDYAPGFVQLMFGGYSDEEKALQALAGEKDFSLAELAAVAGATYGDTNTSLLDEYTKDLKSQGKGYSNEKQLKTQRRLEKLKKKDPDAFNRLVKMGQEGSLKDVKALGEGAIAEASQTALGSAGFTDAVTKYSEDAMAYLGDPSKQVNMQTFAQKFTKQDITDLKNSGPGGLAYGNLIERAVGSSPDAKKAQAELLSRGADLADIGADGAENASKVRAKGGRADKLSDSEAAMEEMSVMFADFKPAAKEFKEGSRMLLEAVHSGSMRLED